MPQIRRFLLIKCHPQREFYLRELVRLSGFALRTVQEEVDRLVAADLLTERRHGNRRYLSANKRHPLFRPVREIVLKKEYDFSKARRGFVRPVSTGKTRITIRIDDDVLEWFRDQVSAAGGGNYQTRINQVLRRAMDQDTEPLETVVRRVVREEIRRMPKSGGGTGKA